ncbi:MAG TPA: MFS transporter [Pseudonocardiaceae bacterium]|nr:MFS transporter [Pseudonocardiaceae bacterium]
MAVKGFPLLLIGQGTSSIGDLCYAAALPWMILSGGGGPVLLGAVLAAYGITRTAGIPVGGILADRFSARKLMLLTDIGRCVVVGLLGFAALHGLPPNWVLLPTAVLIGTADGLFVPASFALLPSLLPDEQLGAGNSMSEVATQLGNVLGPVLGGILVSTAGSGAALLVDAATFAVSTLSLSAVRPRTATAEETDAESAPDVTVRQVVRHGHLLHVFLVVGLIGNLVFAGTSEVALPTLAHRDFGASGYSALLVGLAVGMIVGALIAPRFTRMERPVPVIGALGIVMAVSMASTPFLGGVVGATAAMVVFAIGNSWSGIMVMTMLQTWTPRYLLGRIMSVLMLALTGTFPVSVAVTGLAIGRFGVNGFFVVAGVMIFVGITAAVLSPPFRRYRPGDTFTIPVPIETADVPAG